MEEVACNGVLFNNIYQPPIVSMTQNNKHYSFKMLIQQMKAEMQIAALAQYGYWISYLKYF